MSEIRKKERRGKDTRNFMTLFMMHAYTVKTEENNRGYTVLLQTTLPLPHSTNKNNNFFYSFIKQEPTKIKKEQNSTLKRERETQKARVI